MLIRLAKALWTTCWPNMATPRSSPGQQAKADITPTTAKTQAHGDTTRTHAAPYGPRLGSPLTTLDLALLWRLSEGRGLAKPVVSINTFGIAFIGLRPTALCFRAKPVPRTRGSHSEKLLVPGRLADHRGMG